MGFTVTNLGTGEEVYRSEDERIIQQRIDAAILAEREECADLAATLLADARAHKIVDAIRARK